MDVRLQRPKQVRHLRDPEEKRWDEGQERRWRGRMDSRGRIDQVYEQEDGGGKEKD